MNVTIESLSPSDAREFSSALTLFAEGSGFSRTALEQYNQRWTAETIASAAQRKECILLAAKESGEIVGLVLGAPPEGGVATIIWLLVAPDHIRKGIGRMLFLEACHRYRSIECHKVKLTTTSRKAVGFYKTQGMHVEGYHPEHWWHMDFWSLGILLDRNAV